MAPSWTATPGPWGNVTMIELTGRVAIAIGAGRGLGRLYALELARRGAGITG